MSQKTEGGTEMKSRLIGLGVVSLALSGLCTTPAAADFFQGTPSPSLSPVFGTLVDFDDKATGTLVGQYDYVGQGVASITEQTGGGTFARYSGTQSMPNYVGTGGSAGWDADILIEFSQLASTVGIGVANSSDGETMYAYDSGMTLLESHGVPNGLNVYAGIARDTFDIKYFRIAGSFFAVDDLQFDVVPAPSALVGLVSMAVVGLVIGFRRKLRKV
jgi:hypothetical protein